MNLEQQKFPIDVFIKPNVITKPIITDWIKIIATFPIEVKKATQSLSDTQLDTPYRDGGWTIRQVVHHCADSHMNSFIRFKLALTEENPTIKPYFEDCWATFPDYTLHSIESSIKILEGLHSRWETLLLHLDEIQLNRIFTHPEHGIQITLAENIGIYAWHCKHHLAHIVALKQKENWN